jgi:integrase
MGTLRFELRTHKTDKHGKSPLLLNYQVSGQRKYHNTGLKAFSQSWEADNQQAVYLDKKAAKKLLPSVDYDLLMTDRQVREFNSKLNDLRNCITTIEKRFEMDKISYSSAMIVERLKAAGTPATKKEASAKVLFDFMDKYIEDHKSTREAGSLSVYKALKNHLKDYQLSTGKKVTFENIDYSFFQSFQNFLIQRKGLNNTTVAKQLSTIKTFLNYAKMQGVAVSDRYKDFKIRRESLDVIALTNEEFETLFYFDLTGNKRLGQVRDVFCFACSTGLRYSDLSQLRWEHIKEDEIRLTVKKTKEPLMIPITPYAKAILAKYEGMRRPLPVISNQKLNAYLKELCKLGGIDEPIEVVRFRGVKREAKTYPKYELIGVHTGRKTFATLSLEKGMNAEEVMTITGHKDYKSFKRYVKVTEQRKKIAMLKAWGEVKNRALLKVV